MALTQDQIKDIQDVVKALLVPNAGDKKISALDPMPVIAGADLLAMVDITDNTTKKGTVTQVQTFLDAIRRDGTLALTADWDAGAFKITTTDLDVSGTIQTDTITQLGSSGLDIENFKFDGSVIDQAAAEKFTIRNLLDVVEIICPDGINLDAAGTKVQITTGDFQLNSGAEVNVINTAMGTPSDAALLTSKAIDDAIAAGDYWDRSGTTLIPKTAGDGARIDGLLQVGNIDPTSAKITFKTLNTQADLEFLNLTEAFKFTTSGSYLIIDPDAGSSIYISSKSLHIFTNDNTNTATTLQFQGNGNANGILKGQYGGDVNAYTLFTQTTNSLDITFGSSTTLLDIAGDMQISSGVFSLASGTTVNNISIDDTLAGDSDDTIVTEQAIKAYVDAHSESMKVAVPATKTSTGAIGNWALDEATGYHYVCYDTNKWARSIYAINW